MQKQKHIPDTKEPAKTEITNTPLTYKEVKKQLRSGKLTQEQAIALIQKYMDSLEYNDAPLASCGGIQPLPLLPPEADT